MSNKEETVHSLRKHIAQVEHQLLIESSQCKQLEQRLDEERRALVPPDHAAAMDKRVEEIRQLKAEKQQLQEWLSRGINEAQRVSNEAFVLSQVLASSKQAESTLEEELEHLSAATLHLEREILETESASVQKDHANDETEGAHDIMCAQYYPKLHRASALDDRKAELESRITALQARLAVVETVETAMDCLAASVRRAHHELGKTTLALLNGTLFERARQRAAIEQSTEDHADESGDDEDYFDTDSFDSADGASPTRYAPAVLASTKTDISGCDTNLAAIWAALGRFDLDWKHALNMQNSRHDDVYQALFRDRKDTLEFCQDHIDKMREEEENRQTKLEEIQQIRENALIALQSRRSKTRESSLTSPLSARSNASRSDANGMVSSNVSSPAQSPKSPRSRSFASINPEKFSVLTFIRTERDANDSIHTQLAAEKEKLTKKLEVWQKDYNAVKGMKRMYRDMETKQYELKVETGKLDIENRRMKLHLWEVETAAPLMKAAKAGAGKNGAAPQRVKWTPLSRR